MEQKHGTNIFLQLLRACPEPGGQKLGLAMVLWKQKREKKGDKIKNTEWPFRAPAADIVT